MHARANAFHMAAQSCFNHLYNIEHDNEIVVLIGEIRRG